MSKELEMKGCGITIITRNNTFLELFLNFVRTNEVTTVVSPKFTVYGVVNFEFKVQRKNTDSFILFVRFQKKRVNDKLDYSITYSHWTHEEMKFDTSETWHFVCFDGLIGCRTITVKVNLIPLTSICASLYEDTKLTDFKLLGDDGYVLLHKTIAAAYSPFFKNMFLGQWKETAEGVIEVPGTSKVTLEHLKEYMYLGTFPDTCVPQLLLLSKFYMMEDLESRCLFKIRSVVTQNNVVDLLEFAVTNKQTQLLYEILDTMEQVDLKVNEIEEFQKYI